MTTPARHAGGPGATPGLTTTSLVRAEGLLWRGDKLARPKGRRRVTSTLPAPSGCSVAANTLASGASDRGCESLRPDHSFAVSSNSRTTGFEPVNGGAGAQQRDRATAGRAHRAEREEREPILLPQPIEARDYPVCALRHFHGSQALIVKPPALNRQNSEHYRGGPPRLGGAAVSAAPS